MEQMKKPYAKPTLTLHGSVESITGFGPEQHDVFGGGFLSTKHKCTAKGQGPADKMS